jgi:invasion protein IalB
MSRDRLHNSGSAANGNARRANIAGLAIGAVLLGGASLHAQQTTVAAWRVECSGDGKTLDCRAVQQMIQQDTRQIVAHFAVRLPSDAKAPVMMIQLPLGLNLAEPIQMKVDNGAPDKYPIQTCTATGCFAGMPLNEKLVAAMRSGQLLRLAFQDSNKRPIAVDVPLLGFGLALDKAK